MIPPRLCIRLPEQHQRRLGLQALLQFPEHTEILMDKLLTQIAKRPPQVFHKSEGSIEDMIQLGLLIVNGREAGNRNNLMRAHANVLKTIARQLEVDLRRSLSFQNGIALGVR